MSRQSHLSAGNVITTSWLLYRSQFKHNWKISIVAALWRGLFLGFFILLGLLGMMVLLGFVLGGKLHLPSARSSVTANPWLALSHFASHPTLILWSFGIGCVGLTFSVLGIAMFRLRLIQMARFTYGIVSGQPETPKMALRNLNPRLWQFWRLGIIITVLQTGLNYLIDIPTEWIGQIVQSLLGEGSRTLLSLLLIIVQGILTIAASGVLALTDIVMAMERVNSLTAISRAWRLAHRHVMHVVLITLTSYLVILPPYLVVTAIPLMAGLALFQNINPTRFYIFLGSVALFMLLTLILEILLLPVLPIVQAVTYYDLRVRQEGLGMKLRSHV